MRDCSGNWEANLGGKIIHEHMFETAVAYVAIPALMLPFIGLIQMEEYLAVLLIINVPIIVIYLALINLYLLIWRWVAEAVYCQICLLLLYYYASYSWLLLTTGGTRILFSNNLLDKA